MPVCSSVSEQLLLSRCVEEHGDKEKDENYTVRVTDRITSRIVLNGDIRVY